ncbi:MAG: T9SS type A sorting domain-containing protein [Bacteroidales bacterium]|nr:T9SS type A sorting domain-containing protein [Bacteroidales bacterium]MDD4604520.1 T9SS type A sorting domain-containing protein [Bacteroidales bacterium]
MRTNIKIFLGLLFISFFTTANAQVLGVDTVSQRKSQWCWAACSACILNYYNKPTSQCTIADFARLNYSHEQGYFGNIPCCNEPNDCNKPNYNWGDDGSIQKILEHFGEISNTGSGPLDTTTIANELKNNRPFIILWQWNDKSGHFIVGYGLENNKLYYMNPGVGEGKKIADYDWVLSNADHTWTSTNVLLGGAGLPDLYFTSQQFIYPNPTTGIISFKAIPASPGTMIEISNINGINCFNGPFPASGKIDLSAFPKGLYILRVISDDHSVATKVVLQ